AIANDARESDAEVFETRDDDAAYFDRRVLRTGSRQLDAAPLKEPRPQPIEVVEQGPRRDTDGADATRKRLQEGTLDAIADALADVAQLKGIELQRVARAVVRHAHFERQPRGSQCVQYRVTVSRIEQLEAAVEVHGLPQHV